MPKIKSSRRTTGFLKDSEYDHEIVLVDHDGRGSPSPSPSGSASGSGPSASRPRSAETTDVVRSNTRTGLLATPGENEDHTAAAREPQPAGPLESAQDGQLQRVPSIEVEEPTPYPADADADADAADTDAEVRRRKPSEPERESAIDILYENERGGFVCGVALFSSKALGSLDPSPWTNAFHKVSPTSIKTAQLPDPTWQWAWPDWRVNHQEGMDDNGWEYSFAFSKKFSWHGPRWWNSFVRRRAWIRKRIKKKPEDVSSDPHMLRTDYFTVQPATSRPASMAASILGSRSSVSQLSTMSTRQDQERLDIEDVDTLLRVLRRSRIDREKLEAAENFLQHAGDISSLQDNMHEIMTLFVFQASRRLLLTRLIQTFDETVAELERDGSDQMQRKKADLEAAIGQADEEVRKLAYWSDVKRMAASGRTDGAVDAEKGWHEGWEGVDQSGPAEPNNGQLP